MNDFRLETIEHDSGITVVNIFGELDMNNAPGLRAEMDALAERDRPQVAVNLSQITFIDSTGLGILAGGRKKAQEKNGNLVVFGASDHVKRVLSVTGLTSVFASVDTLDEAIAVLKQAQPEGSQA